MKRREARRQFLKRILDSMLRFALKDRDYRLIVIGFGTCGFNMSIIESHLFSQYLSYGIDGSTASLTLTVYGIATMIGAAGTGFLGLYSNEKRLRLRPCHPVVISLAFLFCPNRWPSPLRRQPYWAFSGDATVPPTSGIISKIWLPKHGRLIWLYLDRPSGRRLFQCLSRRIFVDIGVGYGPLWLVNSCWRRPSLRRPVSEFEMKTKRIEYKGNFNVYAGTCTREARFLVL